MNIIYGFGQWSIPQNGTAVALGFFDGVHNGHKSLLKTLTRVAQENSLESVVYTFADHPGRVTRNEVKLLCSNRQKAGYIAETGVSELIFDWFDESFSRITPDEFAREILVKKLNARIVVAGDNYSFGYKGSGRSEDLIKLGEKYGFRAVIVPRLKCKCDGQKVTVSSSLLRTLVASGRMTEFRKLTGHNYTLEGTVVKGREVGRKIGFPTANIRPDKRSVLPEKGVYATRVRSSAFPDNEFKAITNVGSNPTFDDHTGGTTIESYLLDFKGDLYGAAIEIEMISKIRDEKRFENPDELSRQIMTDAGKRRRMK